MRLAVITPIPHLSDLCTSMDNCQFALAHLVQESEEYKEFYTERAVKGDWVILDNGAYEFGSSMNADTLIDLAKQMRVDEVVAPDILKDFDTTIDMTMDFVSTLSKSDEFQVMGVIHSLDPDEAMKAYTMFMECGVDTIGFPRWLGNENKRSWIVKTLLTMLGQEASLEHHLLGVSDPLELCQYNSRIRSVDTSFPCKWGFHMMYNYNPLIPPYYRERWERVPFNTVMTPQQVARARECREVIRHIAKRSIL